MGEGLNEPRGGPRDAGPRQKLKGKRLSGHLVQWKGKYGWIEPDEPIDHHEAEKRGGKVYVAVEDIEGPELSNKCRVTFSAYVDGTGLGAQNVRKAAEVSSWQGKGGYGGYDGYGGYKGGKGGKGGGFQNGWQGVAQPAWAKKGAGRGFLNVPPWRQSQAWGKAAGKGGKGWMEEEEAWEEEREPPPPPDKTARERLIPQRILGKLTRWRGTIGWIKPLEKIEHPEAQRHRRGIYLHEVDVQHGYEMWQGAQVSFFLYVDSDGLGAEKCLVTKEQPGDGPAAPVVQKRQMAPKAKVKAAKPPGFAPSAMVINKFMKEQAWKKRRKEEAASEGEKSKAGPDLPRERISDLPMSGEVVAWKGKFGWLKCNQEIEHELAGKHEGKIYVHEKDVLDGGTLKVGQTVEFHVYADASGLGAEEALATSA